MKVIVPGAAAQLGRAFIEAASPEAEIIPATCARLDISNSAAVSGFPESHAYRVLDTTSLHPIGVERGHWRQPLRSVLGEIKSG